MSADIKMQVLDHSSQMFSLIFERPGRAIVTIVRSPGGDYIFTNVYDGVDIALDQRPLFEFDGSTLNQNVTIPPTGEHWTEPHLRPWGEIKAGDLICSPATHTWLLVQDRDETGYKIDNEWFRPLTPHHRIEVRKFVKQ